MGISIAIEGSEGAGKSTLNILTHFILSETTKFPVMMTREPGGTDFGEYIRNTLRMEMFQDIHPLAATFLYSAPRAELFFKVEKPFLDKNPDGILLKDRCWLSTTALQKAEGADQAFVDQIVKPFTTIPDKFFLIDIPVDETIVRVNAAKHYSSDRQIDWRDNVSRDRLICIRENYLNFAVNNPGKVIMLDCYSDLWESAKRIARESLVMVAEKEGMKDSSFEVRMDNYLASEMKRIRGLGRFDYSEKTEQIEKTRLKYSFPSREVLQAKMHEDWRSLGLEGASPGVERRN